MSVVSEKVEGRLITIRTPLYVRKMLIWDIDIKVPDTDEFELLSMDGRVRRRVRRTSSGEKSSDERTGNGEDGRRRRKTRHAENADGG